MNIQVRPIDSLSLKELWELRDEQGDNTPPAILRAIEEKEAQSKDAALAIPLPPQPIC